MDREITLAGNRDTTLLKIIAFVCMVADHTGKMFFSHIPEMRIIGRIAFPLYCWCLVVGACSTRHPVRYGIRLAAMVLLCQPFYMLGLQHGWTEWNVLATLFLGYIAVQGLRRLPAAAGALVCTAALILPCFVSMDYGWRGVLFCVILYASRGSSTALAAAITAYCLFWGSSSSLVTGVFGVKFTSAIPAVYALDIVKTFLRLQGLAVLALPLILWRRNKRLQGSKALFYAAYPVHLTLIWIARCLVGQITLQESLRMLLPFLE